MCNNNLKYQLKRAHYYFISCYEMYYIYIWAYKITILKLILENYENLNNYYELYVYNFTKSVYYLLQHLNEQYTWGTTSIL